MSSTKTKKVLHQTTWLVFQSVLALALLVILIIMVTQTRNVTDPVTVDPTVGYSPTHVAELSNKTHIGEWLMSTPLTWVALGLLILIWICTLASKNFVPGVLSIGVAMLIVFISGFATTSSSEDTFSTWAKERYGIEIQSYPEQNDPDHKPSIFFPKTKVDTNTIIILDDGQAVSVKTFVNARSDEALLIVDRSDKSDSPDELDTIVEP